jgi:hypothetical protein
MHNDDVVALIAQLREIAIHSNDDLAAKLSG